MCCPPNLDFVLHGEKIKEVLHHHTWNASSATQDNAHGFILNLSKFFNLRRADNEDGQGILDGLKDQTLVQK